MQTETIVKELLKSACPSIKYRIRTEILGQASASHEMEVLQNEILLDPGVREVLSWQQPDGWLSWDFHGSKSLETGMRVLCEKGDSRQHPAVRQAVQALEKHPERLERGIGKAGRLLDEMGFGGSRMIEATVWANAGLEDGARVQEQVYEALAGFRAVLDVDSIEEIVEDYKGRLVFKPGLRWPGIYHLRLLAFTHKWRNAEHQAMLVEAVKRLARLSPFPNIYVRSKSSWIAPASFGMHEFTPDMESMGEAEWMMWFHRMECLARLGVVPEVPELKDQVDTLESLLEEGNCWFTRKLNHPWLTKWGAYTGLRLEPDWRHPKHRIYDLTFRSMLIRHYFERSKGLPPKVT